jgi:hypothetical protein
VSLLEWAQLAALLLAGLYFIVKLAQGWLMVNLSLSVESERCGRRDGETDDLAISVHLTKGGNGSVRIYDALLAGLWSCRLLDGVQQTPSVGGRLALECVQTTAIGQCAADILGNRYIIRICGAQTTVDEVPRPGTEAPLEALAGVHEGVRKDVSSVHPDIDGQLLDRALDPTSAGVLRGRLQRPLNAHDSVDVSPPRHHLDERVELDPFGPLGRDDSASPGRSPGTWDLQDAAQELMSAQGSLHHCGATVGDAREWGRCDARRRGHRFVGSLPLASTGLLVDGLDRRPAKPHAETVPSRLAGRRQRGGDREGHPVPPWHAFVGGEVRRADPLLPVSAVPHRSDSRGHARNLVKPEPSGRRS